MARLVVAGLNSRPLLEFMTFSMETDLTLDLSGKNEPIVKQEAWREETQEVRSSGKTEELFT